MSTPSLPLSRVRKWALVGYTLLLLAVGIVVGLGVAPEGDELPDTSSASPRSASSETAHANSESGAVSAATTFAQVMAGPTGDLATYRRAVEAIAAPGWESRALELANNTIKFIDSRYGEGGRIAFNPIKYRVASYLDGEAAIELWGVALGSGPKIAGIEESWITAKLHLVWIDASWKVEDQSSLGGPTPELLRAEGGPSASRVLGEFKDFARAPSP